MIDADILKTYLSVPFCCVTKNCTGLNVFCNCSLGNVIGESYLYFVLAVASSSSFYLDRKPKLHQLSFVFVNFIILANKLSTLSQYYKFYKIWSVKIWGWIFILVEPTWNWALAGLFFFSFSAATSRNIFIAVSVFLPILYQLHVDLYKFDLSPIVDFSLWQCFSAFLWKQITWNRVTYI